MILSLTLSRRCSQECIILIIIMWGECNENVVMSRHIAMCRPRPPDRCTLARSSSDFPVGRRLVYAYRSTDLISTYVQPFD